MEGIDQSDAGYPEEAPAGAVPDDASRGGESAVRERARPDDADDAPDNDDGKATGNPNS